MSYSRGQPAKDQRGSYARIDLPTTFDPSKYSSKPSSVASISERASQPRASPAHDPQRDRPMTSRVLQDENLSPAHSSDGSSVATEKDHNSIVPWRAFSEKPRAADAKSAPSTSWADVYSNHRLRSAPTDPFSQRPIHSNKEPIITDTKAGTKNLRSLHNTSSSTRLPSSSDTSKMISSTQTVATQSISALSAGQDAKIPCTFAGCTHNFQTRRELIRHKDEEHDYCKVCDLDFEDDDAYIRHKLQSERHISCGQCYLDFRSEEGRDRHFKLMHSTQNNIKCRGCGENFPRGASLLVHFEQNLCRGRGETREQREATRIKPEYFNRNRAMTALDMERATQQRKEGGETGIFSTLVPPVLGESLTAGSVSGGVPVDLNDRPDFMNYMEEEDDEDDPMTRYPGLLSMERKRLPSPPASVASSNLLLSERNYPALNAKNLKTYTKATDVDTNVTTAGWVVEGALLEKTPTPTVHAHPKAGQAQDGFVKAMSDLSMSQKLFPKACPTPAESSGGGPSIVPSKSGFSQNTEGSRDFNWWADPFDGTWHCPFQNQSCHKKFESKAKLEEHLSGWEHRGALTNCPSCLRRFKTPSALAAHLESATTRCTIRESKHYGNTLAQVSGGYLGLNGLHPDGSPWIKEADKNEVPGVKW